MQVGARIDPDRDAGELTMPQQRLVQIARALGADARVLILDEPTASLSEEDTQNLFNVIRGLRGARPRAAARLSDSSAPRYKV